MVKCVLGRQPPTSVFAVASHLLLESVSWVGNSAPPSWLPGLDLGLDPNLPHGAVAARGRVLQHPDLLILDPPTDVAVLILGRLRGWAAAPRPLLDAMADTEATAAAGVEAVEGATAGIARALWPKAPRSIVVERLSKNINENHLHEIFGEFGPIKDLDLPINRTCKQIRSFMQWRFDPLPIVGALLTRPPHTVGTNRGTAYILYDYEGDAEAAIAHMHEAQVDGATINVSIVLPRRKLSPAPPMARRGANIDPRVPFGVGRGGGEVAEDDGVTPHRRADIITDQMFTGHHHAHLQSRRWEGLDLPGVEAAGIAAAPETLSLLGRGPGHPCPDDGAATMWVRAGVEVGALATLALVTGADPRAALEFAKNLVIPG
ncbi:unnamed protein product [Clonostachys rhizophaga]|uniref:RRM domain-containing protein n=1 Tax=Clonostachys rhizophaga TaxID=160324 RepID=A0A9N9YLC1_9HYPO|nr:unnamed protein product [Clonostachys rhizophaga]